MKKSCITQRWETHQLPEPCLPWVSPCFSSRWEIVAEIFQPDEAVESGVWRMGKDRVSFPLWWQRPFPAANWEDLRVSSPASAISPKLSPWVRSWLFIWASQGFILQTKSEPRWLRKAKRAPAWAQLLPRTFPCFSNRDCCAKCDFRGSLERKPSPVCQPSFRELLVCSWWAEQLRERDLTELRAGLLRVLLLILLG